MVFYLAYATIYNTDVCATKQIACDSYGISFPQSQGLLGLILAVFDAKDHIITLQSSEVFKACTPKLIESYGLIWYIRKKSYISQM